ncbi:hypothetical protein IJJ49_01325 [Candidatus Saccharibacteria bacterium]|nr:hypothetical protein [Candidatus Saccharibacteria bacterium]
MDSAFLKYLAKEKKGEIFHSSAAGRAQNAEGIGTTSSSTFAERQAVEKNRQVIRGYNDSRVVSQAYSSAPRAKKYVPPTERVMGEAGAVKGTGATERASFSARQEKGGNYGNRGQITGARGAGGSNYRPTPGFHRTGS